MEVLQKIKKIELPYELAGCLSKEGKNTILKRYTYLCVHCSIIYCDQDLKITCVNKENVIYVCVYVCVYIYIHTLQWNIIQLFKKRKSCHLQQQRGLEGIVLSEIYWRKTNTVLSHSYDSQNSFGC